jgi:Flp pilus assembly protein TadB
MLLTWLVLLIGTEIGIRTDAFAQLFTVTSTNNLRFKCYFATWAVSFLIYFSGLRAFFTWYTTMLALILLPIVKILLKELRKRQIPAKSLAFLDLILLNMKAGQSLRKSFAMVLETEKTWFNGFQASLAKSLEVGNLPETESEWFNVWAQEIIQIERSRNKVVEQLEILRRYTKQEQHFNKKLKNATAGPRAQVFVMSLLFLCLNILAFRSLQSHQINTLFPLAWFLFLLGIATVFIVTRSFKWKV